MLAARGSAIAVAGVVALAFTARLGAQLYLGFHEAPEVWEEGTIAESLARGEGYVYQAWGTTHHAFRAPAYAFLLAAAYSVFGISTVTAGILQAALGAMLTALAVALGMLLGGPRAAVLGGALVALHPGLLVYAAKVHQLNLDAPLAAAGMLVALRLTGARWRDATLLGLLGGVMVLSRPTLLPIVAVGALLPLASGRLSSRRVLPAVLAVGLVAVFALGWMARNQVVVGLPTLTTGTGITLWIGHNPAASGGTLTDDGVPILDAVPEMRDAIWGRPEVEQDRIFTRAALAYIAEDPLRAVRAVASHFISFWSFGAHAGALYPAGWLVAYQLYYWPVLLLTMAGLTSLVTGPAGRAALALAVSLAGVALVQSLFYVDGRHRWMIEPVMLVLASVAIVGLLDRARSRLASP